MISLDDSAKAEKITYSIRLGEARGMRYFIDIIPMYLVYFYAIKCFGMVNTFLIFQNERSPVIQRCQREIVALTEKMQRPPAYRGGEPFYFIIKNFCRFKE